ncbi:hypothetical protein GCM10007860_09000 [Chitiniphilus shinanonensis]|uniref:Uncharacterized protein n=1 Tax=Chitiniphilus shinanonensis TaxID=553088 RepID=A0ABQ6BRB5_9NEIS|nr:hypothetical protein [Chitiniphilus shinanonensis]GLS03755.1 hypothetical protein GCM10007860_09000 [Chitiniphilus shinanonensis]
MNANQLKWHARQWSRYAGLLGVVGIALLLGALMIYRQDVVPFERDLADREQTLERNLRALRQQPVAATASAVEDQSLNAPDSFTEFLRQSAQLAGKNRVSVLQSEYRVVTEAEGHLVRYGVQFPANGRYADLRGFIADLEKMPGVRVEAMSLSRLQIGDELLSIQLQLSYLTEVQ